MPITKRIGEVDVQVLLFEITTKFNNVDNRPKSFSAGHLLITNLATKKQWLLTPDEFEDAGYEITVEIREILKLARELIGIENQDRRDREDEDMD